MLNQYILYTRRLRRRRSCRRLRRRLYQTNDDDEGANFFFCQWLLVSASKNEIVLEFACCIPMNGIQRHTALQNCFNLNALVDVCQTTKQFHVDRILRIIVSHIVFACIPYTPHSLYSICCRLPISKHANE